MKKQKWRGRVPVIVERTSTVYMWQKAFDYKDEANTSGEAELQGDHFRDVIKDIIQNSNRSTSFAKVLLRESYSFGLHIRDIVSASSKCWLGATLARLWSVCRSASPTWRRSLTRFQIHQDAKEFFSLNLYGRTIAYVVLGNLLSYQPTRSDFGVSGHEHERLQGGNIMF